MKRFELPVLSILLSIGAIADTYNAATNQLTVDSVQLNGVVYSNVIVTVENVLSVGGSTQLSPNTPIAIGPAVFNGGASPSVQVKFNMPMAATGSAVGDFVQKDSHWQSDQETFVVDLTSFKSGGSIIFPSSSFQSVGGVEPGQSVVFTFPPLTASAGAPTWTKSGYGATTGDSSARYWTVCDFTIVVPISGNTPITFTGWQGVWSNGHTQSGTSSFTVDPTVYDSLQWVSNQPFLSGGNTVSPTPFTVNYTISYTVPATGQSASTSTLLSCGP